ncbi:outer membrane beta-barrel family protein [Mucilaginibacter psychrotolerans]|uniref:TonB-dependent receptor n=1 Tax=Mucilaginibacter psychrotolerans TaxID=1524096 RepID=A0A4Y8S6A0_9SPHI|nr:outer membrane beta-barrel family protein [Mucilaginibacter psychrotolerans]TFF33924.1 TonB-dependent receptor [Mucilaginibacter psychrotolerans]
MRRIILLLIIFCASFTAKAQFGVGGGGGSSVIGKISGTIVDSLTKKPVDYATISLFKSGGKVPINGVLTDEKGNFKLDNIKSGSYKITISFLGYQTKTIDPVTTTASKPDANLGNVILPPNARALKEVQVVGQQSIIENKIDKIVYNAEKDLTAAGGTATDLLSKVPLVAVDINGNVSVRGDNNVRVLINGKPSGATAASLSDVLKSIPASQIKTIEVITSPSAKYDAEGSAGIINIVTKQSNVSGLSGGINTAVGTRQNNGNLNLNYNKNRFNFNTNIGGNASWPQNTLNSSTYENFKNPQFSTSSVGTGRLTRHALVGSVGAGYQFNGFNNINTTFKFNQITFGNTSINDITSAQPYSSNSVSNNKIDGFDWNVDYTHKFKKEGSEISFSTQWSHNSGITNYTNLYTAVLPNIKNNIDGKNNEYTAQVDYVLPIDKVFKLEAGGKSIFRRINSTSDFYSFINNDFVINPATSNVYKYNQNVFAGYSVLTTTLPKGWSLLTGFRLENTDIHGEPFNANQNLASFDQNYNTYVPSLTVQKKLNASNTLKLGYSKRITRPSLQFLNPFVNQSNILAQQVGNPTLSPEVSQTIELGLNSFIKTSIVNVSVYYKRTSGLIEGIADTITVKTLDPATGLYKSQGGTLTTYQNVGNNNSFGGSFFGTINPIKAITIIGSVNAYTYKPDPTGRFLKDQSQNGTYIQYGGFLRATATLPNNFIAESFVFGSSSRRTIQGQTPTFSILGFGVRRQFMQKKMSVGVNIISPFAEYKGFNSKTEGADFRSSTSFQLPFRSYGITFSYSFGKLSFSQPKKSGVKNDDLKEGDQGMGGGGAPAGGR